MFFPLKIIKTKSTHVQYVLLIEMGKHINYARACEIFLLLNRTSILKMETISYPSNSILYQFPFFNVIDPPLEETEIPLSIQQQQHIAASALYALMVVL